MTNVKKDTNSYRILVDEKTGEKFKAIPFNSKNTFTAAIEKFTDGNEKEFFICKKVEEYGRQTERF